MAITKITTPELFDLSTVNTALRLPNGGTATRPTSPSQGEWRFNTDLKYVEFYDGSDWRQIDTEPTCTTNTVDYPTTNSAYYKLDSSAVDQTTNNYDGTPTDITYYNDQQYSQSAVFNGSSSKIVNSSLSQPSGNLSVSLWIKFYTIPSGQKEFLDWLGGSSQGTVRLNTYDSNDLRFSYGSGSSRYISDDGYTISTGNWYHLVLVIDGSTAKPYFNNNPLTTFTHSGSQSGTGLFLGSNSDGTRFSNCTIDQVRLFDSALNDTQVSQLYNEVQCPCTTDNNNNPTTNVAYYKLDGNANDATNTYNGTWGGTEAYAYGPYGIAGSFNGSSSFIQTSLSLNAASNSVSFWFNADSVGSQNPALYFNNRGGRIDIIINGTSSNAATASNESILINSTTAIIGWNFVSVVFTGWASSYSAGSYGSAITANVYLNGGSAVSLSPTPYGQSDGLRIGRSGGGYYYDGSIDQVRILNTALSPTQITSLYDEVYCNTVSKLNIFNEGTSSCLALYEFEDDAKSTESSGNDATEYNTVAYGGGQYKKGIIFNGSNNGVNLPNILPPDQNASSTFTCWFNTSDTSGNQQTIVNAWNGSTTANKGGYALFKDAGNVLRLVNYYLNSTASGIDGSTNIGDGKWHFVAVVFDYSVGSLTLYLDGSIELKPDGNPVQITGLTTSGDVNPFNGGAELGYQSTDGRYFPGTIDQVRVFNKALSETERLQVYTE